MEKQFFNIKYPFINEGEENFFIDANQSYRDRVRSEMLFTLFTPKGSRIRKPEFGSDLVKYIFEQGDSLTLDSVKNECSETIKKWVKNCIINDIQIVKNQEDEHEIYVKIGYSVKEGNSMHSTSVIVQM